MNRSQRVLGVAEGLACVGAGERACNSRRVLGVAEAEGLDFAGDGERAFSSRHRQRTPNYRHCLRSA